MFRVNGRTWLLQLVEPSDVHLQRSNGSKTYGMTDGTEGRIYISSNLSLEMFDRVLLHELCHAYSFSYSLDIPIEVEEMIADFLATYGRNIVQTADKILENFSFFRLTA